MIVETQAVGPFFKNGFVVGCDETREAVLIDPGDEVQSLLDFAERNGLTIRHILLTHAHVDHVTGVAAAKRALKVPVYLHRDDLFLYDRAVESGAMFGLRVEPQPPIDVFYGPDQVIPFGTYEARVIIRRGTVRAECACRLARGAKKGKTSSSATRCSQARSAEPTFLVATTMSFSRRFGRSCFRSATMRACIRDTGRARPSARSAGAIRF